ncbi:MAG: hypothetical protein AAF267_10400 [Deinococcota bacterium]
MPSVSAGGTTLDTQREDAAESRGTDAAWLDRRDDAKLMRQPPV